MSTDTMPLTMVASTRLPIRLSGIVSDIVASNGVPPILIKLLLRDQGDPGVPMMQHVHRPEPPCPFVRALARSWSVARQRHRQAAVDGEAWGAVAENGLILLVEQV